MKIPLSAPKIVGLLCCLCGVGLLGTNLIRQVIWEKAEGIVLEVIKDDEDNTFRPLAKFPIENGDSVEVEVLQSSNRFYYKKGEKIPIVYPKEDYERAQIDSIRWVVLFPLFIALFGTLILFIPSNLWHVS